MNVQNPSEATETNRMIRTLQMSDRDKKEAKEFPEDLSGREETSSLRPSLSSPPAPRSGTRWPLTHVIMSNGVSVICTLQHRTSQKCIYHYSPQCESSAKSARAE